MRASRSRAESPSLQVGVSLGDVGMRIGLPGRFQDAAGAALLAGLHQPPAGHGRRRHQIGRELDRLQRQAARGVALDVGQRLGAGGEQHRALAAVFVLRQAALHAVERGERAGPIVGGAAVVEHRLARPGERRRGLGGDLGGAARAVGIAAALRFDIEAAQAEQLGFLMPRHGAEGALGGGPVAGHLRRLRAEQQRQRLARRQPRRVVGRAARQR